MHTIYLHNNIEKNKTQIRTQRTEKATRIYKEYKMDNKKTAFNNKDLSYLGETTKGRKVYGCWFGGNRDLSSWLQSAKLSDLDQLDAKAINDDKGTFLFTHQRDSGFINYYPEGVYKPDHIGMWQTNGSSQVLSFWT